MRNRLDLAEEAVPAARDRLDEAGASGVVAQDLSEATDAVVQAVIELDDGPVCPEHLPDPLPGDQLPRRPEQKLQDPKRLAVERQLRAVSTELVEVCVQLEHAETKTTDHRPRRRTLIRTLVRTHRSRRSEITGRMTAGLGLANL